MKINTPFTCFDKESPKNVSCCLFKMNFIILYTLYSSNTRKSEVHQKNMKLTHSTVIMQHNNVHLLLIFFWEKIFACLCWLVADLASYCIERTYTMAIKCLCWCFAREEKKNMFLLLAHANAGRDGRKRKSILLNYVSTIVFFGVFS